MKTPLITSSEMTIKIQMIRSPVLWTLGADLRTAEVAALTAKTFSVDKLMLSAPVRHSMRVKSKQRCVTVNILNPFRISLKRSKKAKTKDPPSRVHRTA